MEPPRRPRPRRRWSFALRGGLAASFLAVLATGAGLAQARYLPDDVVLPGLSIDGQPADPTDVRAQVERRAKALAARPLHLKLPGVDAPVLDTTLGEIGVIADIDETVAVATHVGKQGDVLERAEAAREAREGKLDVPLVTRIDRSVALGVLMDLKEREDVSPVSARLDLEKHATIPEKDGRFIDADGAIALVEALLRDPRADTITLPVASFPPRISAAFLKSLDISTVVAEYETYFGRNGEQQFRGKNIDNAAEKLDGLVISPGEMVSFNEVVGERSEANGFFKSWEIFKGEMVEGMGGGTCQVASTFHAAMFFGGFDVLERLPHSRPSAYIPMGLDSTVVYPGVDLKVRNPHPFPVVVHAKTDGNKLRVELLGKTRPVKVGFGREVLETIPYKRKIVEDPELTGKKVRIKQHGIKGYKIKRTRELTYADGRHRKEEMEDKYPATTEIYEVPVGFDITLLPPLPSDTGEDADLGGNPSPPPPGVSAPAANGTTPTASTDTSAPASDVELFYARGAHAPTAAQKDPAKTLWLRR